MVCMWTSLPFSTTASQESQIWRKGVLHRNFCDYEESPDDILDVPLSEPFFTWRKKMFSRPDGFMLFSEFGVKSLHTSKMLYPSLKIRLQLIRARKNFHMISDNANVTFELLNNRFTLIILLSRIIVTKNMDKLAFMLVEFNCLETLARTFIFPAKENQFIQENIFNKALVRRIAIAKKSKLCFRWIIHWKPILVSTVRSWIN